jgi:hypothetical protein
MEYTGHVKGLSTHALKEKEITIPAGTIVRYNNYKMEAWRMIDAQNTMAQGQITQANLEGWKKLGGPNVSLSGDKTSVIREELKVTGALLFNGTVAHKIIYNAVFGTEKAALFDEVDDAYVLSNPLVAWMDKTGQVLMVDINEVPELVEGTYEVIKIPADQQQQEEKG